MVRHIVDSLVFKELDINVRGSTNPIHDALILAAGNGSRLATHTPKQLLPVLGVPLLARTLFTLQKAGVQRAYVVLGYEAERIRREIEDIDRLTLEIHWLTNEDWRRPNGLSVLAAESLLSGPFVLTVADHVFKPDVVTALGRNAHRLQGIDLAVDYNVGRVLDLDDATKVRIESDRIVGIGKELGTYDAIDTGVFLATPKLFSALRASCAEGEASLSAGVQKLAAAGLARVTDIGDFVWQDVDTPADLAEAERKLLRGMYRPTDGPIARYINRPISTALSRQLVKTRVTPNQLSLGNLGIGLLSGGLAAVGGYVPFLLSGILFQFASILDGSDGEVAKLTFRTSLKGEWIDTICDNISYLAFLVGVLVGVYRSPLPQSYFWSGILGLGAVFLSLANIHFYLRRGRESGSALSVRYGFEQGNGFPVRALRVLKYLGKRDMMALIVLLLAVAGQVPAVLPAAGIGATLLLLPLTTRANLMSLWRSSRSQRAKKVLSLSAHRDRSDRSDWLGDAEPERVTEAAAG